MTMGFRSIALAQGILPVAGTGAGVSAPMAEQAAPWRGGDGVAEPSRACPDMPASGAVDGRADTLGLHTGR